MCKKLCWGSVRNLNGIASVIEQKINDFPFAKEVLFKPAMKLAIMCRRQANQQCNIKWILCLADSFTLQLIGNRKQIEDKEPLILRFITQQF